MYVYKYLINSKYLYNNLGVSVCTCFGWGWGWGWGSGSGSHLT